MKILVCNFKKDLRWQKNTNFPQRSPPLYPRVFTKTYKVLQVDDGALTPTALASPKTNDCWSGVEDPQKDCPAVFAAGLAPFTFPLCTAGSAKRAKNEKKTLFFPGLLFEAIFHTLSVLSLLGCQSLSRLSGLWLLVWREAIVRLCHLVSITCRQYGE